LIGIPTLDILAASQPAARLPLLVAIQAGRSRFAVGWYKSSKNGWRVKEPARVLTLQALTDEVQSPVLVCGEFTSEERQKLTEKADVHLVSAAGSIRRPAILAELAWARWQAGQIDDQAKLAPIYLHVAEPIPS
jgi:tRNA threonylcarbamoyladenosine biosynthesis protein TsaB